MFGAHSQSNGITSPAAPSSLTECGVSRRPPGEGASLPWRQRSKVQWECNMSLVFISAPPQGQDHVPAGDGDQKVKGQCPWLSCQPSQTRAQGTVSRAPEQDLDGAGTDTGKEPCWCLGSDFCPKWAQGAGWAGACSDPRAQVPFSGLGLRSGSRSQGPGPGGTSLAHGAWQQPTTVVSATQGCGSPAFRGCGAVWPLGSEQRSGGRSPEERLGPAPPPTTPCGQQGLRGAAATGVGEWPPGAEATGDCGEQR